MLQVPPEFYLRQFEASPIPTFVWRVDGADFVFESCNEAGVRLGAGVWTSYVGRRASEIYAARPDVLAALQRAWQERRVADVDLRYKMDDGRDVILRVQIVPVPPDRLVIYASDISAEVAAEDALRMREREYRLVIEGASDPVVILDGNGKILEANRRAEEMFGYRSEDVVGAKIDAFIADEDLAKQPIQLDRAAMAEGILRERRLRRADGSLLQAELSLRALDDGRTVVLIRDVTKRSADAAALRRNEELYRKMIELSPDAILVHDGGRIVYVNEAAVRMVGARDRSELIGKPALHFLHPDDLATVQQRVHAITEEFRDVPPLHEKFVRVDGTVIDVEVAGLALEYEGRRSVQVIARDITERLRGDEALRRSEERYRGLVERASESIYRLSLDGTILEVNPATLRITGWREDQLVGAPLTKFIHAGDVARAKEVFAGAMTGERAGKGVFRVLKADGEVAHFDTAMTAEVRGGRVEAIFGMARDITEEVSAADQLRQRESLFSAVLDRLPLGVLITDATGRIVRSNPVADEIWNYHRTRSALWSPETYRAWWSESGLPVTREEWASTRALTRGEVSINEDLDIECFDGERKSILNSAVPLRDETGAITGAIIINQDITEYKAILRQRQQLDVRLRQVISSTSDGICTIDEAGKITLINPAGAQMLGRPDGELLGADFGEVVHGVRSAEGEDRFVGVGRDRLPRPLFGDTFRRADGRKFDVEVSCSPMSGEQEGGAVVAFRDVTQRKALETELERASRFASLGQLAATIAHEFNNVLMGILPFAEAIVRRSESDASLASAAHHISGAVQRGRQITREILKFVQYAEPDARPIRLKDLIEGALPDLRAVAGAGVRISVEPIDSALATRVDQVQVHQVLSNLLANARDAMSGSGEVTISAVACGEGEGEAALPHSLSGDFVCVTVRDCGRGMDAQTLPMIFEPMFTTKKAGGTGLGLAVVQQVVMRHGGAIEVDSEPGKGTEFRIYFPRCAPPPGVTAAPSEPSAQNVRRIVLVEDDPSVSAGLAALLDIEGISVRVVALGLEAEQAVADFTPDAVILDRGLPDVDGIEVFRHLAARWPQLPIIFSTGHGSREEIEDLLRRSHVGHLLKPYSIDDLLQLLEVVVNRGKGSGGGRKEK